MKGFRGKKKQNENRKVMVIPFLAASAIWAPPIEDSFAWQMSLECLCVTPWASCDHLLQRHRYRNRT